MNAFHVTYLYFGDCNCIKMRWTERNCLNVKIYVIILVADILCAESMFITCLPVEKSSVS